MKFDLRKALSAAFAGVEIASEEALLFVHNPNSQMKVQAVVTTIEAILGIVAQASAPAVAPAPAPAQASLPSIHSQPAVGTSLG